MTLNTSFFLPILRGRRAETESERDSAERRMALLDLMIEGDDHMDYEIEVKTIPGFIAAYREGMIDSYSDMAGFVMGFAEMCRRSNPDLECTEDDYCFVTYADPEYRERDISLRYYQSVKKPCRSQLRSGPALSRRSVQFLSPCRRTAACKKDLTAAGEWHTYLATPRCGVHVGK